MNYKTVSRDHWLCVGVERFASIWRGKFYFACLMYCIIELCSEHAEGNRIVKDTIVVDRHVTLSQKKLSCLSTWSDVHILFVLNFWN